MSSDSQSESQETASTSLVEDSLNLTFEDVGYTVRNGILAGGRKTVLAGISGSFSAGELTVIMGQSGAGKSTLMNILAGYTQPTSGGLFVNGRPRNHKVFRRRSCYILQDDQVQDLLTIHESLNIAAELKLGHHISAEQKRRRVEEIINSLGLSGAKNTRAGALSGGQKKRLAIGLELVSDPPVMFLDEPTSGLDSSISKQMVYLLHLLARQGRTVVATMHQPSAGLLQLVDRLYAMVAGRCAYMGTVPMLHPYLEQMNLICPPYHNPVDFSAAKTNMNLARLPSTSDAARYHSANIPVIEICVENASNLVEYSQNGKCVEWTNNISNNTDSKLEGDTNYFRSSILEEVFLTTLPTPTEDPTNKILTKLKSTYSTSFWKQFTILTKRSLLCYWRNPFFTVMITGIHCVMALFIGLLFYNIGEDAKYARENYNCLFFSLMFLMFTAFSAVTITFPEQFPVIRREHFNRWYMTGAYYMATLVSSIPTQTTCTLIYGSITYWLTGQPHDFLRFLGFCWTLMLVSYVALCIGLLNGSMFNVKNGVVFGPFFIMPFVVFSGFFLLLNDAPSFARWLFHASFLKHGLVALTVTMYGLERPKMLCSDLICRYTYPKQILIDREMTEEKFSNAVIALMGIAVIVNISTYIILKIRMKFKW